MKKIFKKDRKHIIIPITTFVLLLVYISLVPPTEFIFIAVFYLLLAVLFFSVFRIFMSFSRNLVWTFAISGILILIQYNLSNYLNILLISAILLTFELYFRKT